MNYYDKNAFNIESIEEDSDGIKWAKRLLLSDGIALLYVIAYIFVCIYYVKQKLILALDLERHINFLIIGSGFFLYLAVMLFVAAVIRKKTSKIDIQEKIYYDLYLYHIIGTKLKRYGQILALAMARLEAQKGDKQMCKNALALCKFRREIQDYNILKNWADGPDGPIDVSLLKKVTAKWVPYTIIEFVLFSMTCLYICFDRDMLTAYGISSILLNVLDTFTALAVAVMYTAVLSLIITRNRSRKAKAIVTTIIFVITMVLSSFIYISSFRNALFYSNTQDEDYDYYDDYYNDYDYSDEEDYSIDVSSEPLNDVDIMNHMITLANYLLDNGVIEDFKEVKLSYTAKGLVRGTIDKDESFEYNLYDNGIKNDDAGNECVELVLEAEPLDEDGNSLGQTEAILKGFYMVNIETSEVIDEHKTHW